MEQNFNQYLNEMKEKNLYSTDVKSEFLNEIFWQAKKDRPCISVTIDFTTEKFINNIAEQIKDEEIKSGTEGSTGDSTTSEPEESVDPITDKISKYILAINKAFKATSGHLFVRGLDNGSLKYYFKMYSKKSPEGNVTDFKSRIDKNLELSFIKNNMVVKDDTYAKVEISNLKNDPNELNPGKNESDKEVEKRLHKSIFVENIVKKISGTIKSRKEKLDNAAKNGELKQVYCVPFKISETLINKIKDESNTLNDFWQNLVEKVNENLINALSSISDFIKEYRGIVPIKSYGFNAYFTDRDAAEQFAEQISQDNDTKISERKRYEKKIANYVQVLQKDIKNINGVDLQPRECSTLNPEIYFQSTLFAREKIVPMIKDKFEDAALIQVNRYTFKITKDIINTILQDTNIKNLVSKNDDTNQDKTELDVNKIYPYIKNILIKYCLDNDTFIGAGSTDDAQFELYFSTKESVEHVKNLISQHLNINKENDIAIKQVTLTNANIKQAKANIANDTTAAKQFLSFVREIENNSEHNEIKAEALELKLSDTEVKKLFGSDTSSAVTTLINTLKSYFNKDKINSFIGFTFADKFRVIVYFTDTSGIDYVKAEYGNNEGFKIGESNSTNLSNTEFNKIKNPNNLELQSNLMKCINDAKNANKETAESKKYTWDISKTLDPTITVGAFKSAFNNINEITIDKIYNESFKISLFNYLMDKINIINESTKNERQQFDNAADNEPLNKQNTPFLAVALERLIGKINILCENIAKHSNGLITYDKGNENGDIIGTITCVGKFKNKLEEKLIKPINIMNPSLIKFIQRPEN